MTSKALVVLSGGQDSTTCLYWTLQQGYDQVHAITFDYMQKHTVEVDAARLIVNALGSRITSHEVLHLGPVLSGTSPLVDHNATLEQYDDGVLPGGLELTFVPMRNQLFLTLAANRAYVLGCTNLVTGVCQEDSGGYPDCRQVFIDAVEAACNAGTFTGGDTLPAIKIHTPLMNLTKAQSIDLAWRLDGAYAALAWTHTAYDGAYPPSGADHATVLRAAGFEASGLPDPLILRACFEHRDFKLPNTPNYAIAARIFGSSKKRRSLADFAAYLGRVMIELRNVTEPQEGAREPAN